MAPVAAVFVPMLIEGGLAAGVSVGTTLGVVSAVSTAFSVLSAVSAIGGIVGGINANKAQTAASVNAANYNAQAANYNAQVAENNATQSQYAAQTQAEQIRQDTARRISTISNKFAKGGVVTTAGSSLLVALDQASQGEYNAQQELYAGNLEASGYKSQAELDRNKAAVAGTTAANARTAGSINQSTSILTGVSKLASVGSSLLG